MKTSKRLLSNLEVALLNAISKSQKRRETSLMREYSGGVEDALFELVQFELIEWFGDNEKPLWYRITDKGRAHIANGPSTAMVGKP